MKLVAMKNLKVMFERQNKICTKKIKDLKKTYLNLN